MNEHAKIISKRYGMRAYEAYIQALLEKGIKWREEEDNLTIRVYTAVEEES